MSPAMSIKYIEIVTTLFQSFVDEWNIKIQESCFARDKFKPSYNEIPISATTESDCAMLPKFVFLTKDDTYFFFWIGYNLVVLKQADMAKIYQWSYTGNRHSLKLSLNLVLQG